MLNNTSRRSNIEFILWDLDDCLYRQTLKLKSVIESGFVRIYAKKKNLPFNDSIREKFRSEWKKYGSKTGYMTEILKIENIGNLVHSTYDRRDFISRDEKLIDMFSWFKKNLPSIKHIIISNSPYNSVIQTLEALDLEASLFLHFFTSDLIDGKKPSPFTKPSEDLCRHIVAFLNSDAGKILAIGDKEKSDIIPAKSVGMKTARVYGESKLADFSFSDVYQVLKIFQKT